MTRSAVIAGSDNVFADLGLSEPSERQTKVRLAMALNALLNERDLKQREIAQVLDIPQPKVSALVRYRLDGFSVERLMELLTRLDQNVEVRISPAGLTGKVSVTA